jgi:hypothetical protein
MRVIWFATGTISVLGVALFAACIGSDPSPSTGGPAAGEHLGPCLPGDKCNAGLECRDTVCLTPGEPAPDGGGEGGDGAPDTSTDAGTDADAPCVQALPQVPTSDIRCGATKCTIDSGAPICCGVASAPTCNTPATCGSGAVEVEVACNATSQCQTPTPCCATLAFSDPNACPKEATLDRASCGGVGLSCTGTEIQLCDVEHPDCVNGKCTAVLIRNGGGNDYMVGACL